MIPPFPFPSNDGDLDRHIEDLVPDDDLRELINEEDRFKDSE